tara:strand:+ start:538 stop:1899 length:1362 start_codon:yes stop_codon:yes gene_type:complete
MFRELLAQREASGDPIHVGIIGAGKFGSGLVVQLSKVPGICASAVADISLERARDAYHYSGVDVETIFHAETAGQLGDAISKGQPAVTEDATLITGAGSIDVVVEATGIPEAGADNAVSAIDNGKHLVMVNIETDVTVGTLLKSKADKAGVVYTLVDGDQPGCIMNLYEWAQTLGFEIVAAGRGTIYYKSDREGTPDSVAERFQFSEEILDRRHINVKMYNSFRDGTKAQLEMTALANMTGFSPDIRGMHEPSCNLEDIPRVFCLKEEGGILHQDGVVELVNSVAVDGISMLPNPLKMGVFVVIRTDHPFIREDLRSYDCLEGADGKTFLLYRPYHLVAVEAPMSIAKAFLYSSPTGAPQKQPVADVIAVAKRNLKKGEILDGSGGFTVNGIIEKTDIVRNDQLLPLGLASEAVLLRDVTEGEAITYATVILNEHSHVLQLRREQDQLMVSQS